MCVVAGALLSFSSPFHSLLAFAFRIRFSHSSLASPLSLASLVQTSLFFISAKCISRIPDARGERERFAAARAISEFAICGVSCRGVRCSFLRLNTRQCDRAAWGCPWTIWEQSN
jgi:hypothetical protein